MVLLLGKKKFRDFPDRKNSYSVDYKNHCFSSAPVNLNCTWHWAATPGATKLSRKLQFHSWPLEGGSKTESVPTHRRLLHCSTLQLGKKKGLVSMENGIILQLILFAVWFSPPKMQRQTDIGWFQLCSPLTQLRFSHRFFLFVFLTPLNGGSFLFGSWTASWTASLNIRVSLTFKGWSSTSRRTRSPETDGRPPQSPDQHYGVSLELHEATDGRERLNPHKHSQWWGKNSLFTYNRGCFTGKQLRNSWLCAVKYLNSWLNKNLNYSDTNKSFNPSNFILTKQNSLLFISK